MHDYQTRLEKLRMDAAECRLICDLATDVRRTLPMTRRQADARNNQLLMADESQRNRAELFEIEGQLQDERLKEDDRHAPHGAQQALRNVLDRDTWQPASQTFYQIGNRPIAPASPLIH